jgi:DNA-binding CsgD family transcriptional regulator
LDGQRTAESREVSTFLVRREPGRTRETNVGTAFPDAIIDPMDGTIVGRDAELAEVLAAVADDRSVQDGAVLVTGEPGMGKTTLWTAAVDTARRRAATVLLAQPAESDLRRSFAGLADLLRPVPADAYTSLPRPLRRALDVALLRAEPTADADERGVGPAVLAILERLAARTPVVIAIDDLQWLDASSAEALAFAVRRLGNAAAQLLLARRSGEITAFEGALRGIAIRRIELAPLSLGAVRRLLVDRLGLELPRRRLRELHLHTGGNPLFALELAALGETADDVPAALDEVLAARLADLPETLQDLLVAIALTPAPEPAELSEALGPEHLRDAEQAGLVVLDERGVRASHPMLASVALARSRRPARRRLHRALAGVTTDTERRVRHEAAASDTPNAALASALATAGDRAAARGALEEAVDLAAEALRLTPDGDAAKPERLLAQIERLHLAGDDRRSVELAIGAVETLPAGPVRARVRLVLNEAGFHIRHLTMLDTQAGVDAALADAPSDPRLQAMILARRGHIRNTGTVTGIPLAIRDARRAWELADGQWPDAAAEAAHTLAWALHLRGRSTAAVGERARASGLGSPDLFRGFDRLEAEGLMLRGRIAEARAILERLLTLADERGETFSFVAIRLQLIELELRAGRWAVASALLDDWAESPERDLTTPSAFLRTRSFVASGIGDGAEAERLATEALRHSEERGLGWDRLEALRALGLARLAGGRPADAIDPLLTVWSDNRHEGVADPAVFPVAGELVDGLVQIGDLAAAGRVARSVARFGATCKHPWAEVTGERGLALVALAGGEPGASERAGAAAARLGALGFPFDEARTLLAVGRLERRRRQWGEARRALEAAGRAFDGLRSTGWGAVVAGELQRIGGRRPDHAGALTPAERSVAALVADGLSNKEIAHALAVSVATVERHLSRAYAKLGVQSRAQLTRRLSAAATD